MTMQNSNVLKLILFFCGIAILVAGAIALFNTDYFTARNGIDIAGNLSLYNDYKATGGLFMGVGMLILIGIIHSKMAFTSTVVAMIAHLSIGIGRTISIINHGMPADALFKATVVEIKDVPPPSRVIIKDPKSQRGKEKNSLAPLTKP